MFHFVRLKSSRCVFFMSSWSRHTYSVCNILVFNFKVCSGHTLCAVEYISSRLRRSNVLYLQCFPRLIRANIFILKLMLTSDEWCEVLLKFDLMEIIHTLHTSQVHSAPVCCTFVMWYDDERMILLWCVMWSFFFCDIKESFICLFRVGKISRLKLISWWYC